MLTIVTTLLLLTAVYGLLIGGLTWLLRRLRVSARRAILLGFLCFGLGTGLLAAWAWPFDSSVYVNVYAVLLGDKVYQCSAQYLGDPWLLRVPQVYVLISPLTYGLVGLLGQAIRNRLRPLPTSLHP